MGNSPQKLAQLQQEQLQSYPTAARVENVRQTQQRSRSTPAELRSNPEAVNIINTAAQRIHILQRVQSSSPSNSSNFLVKSSSVSILLSGRATPHLQSFAAATSTAPAYGELPPSHPNQHSPPLHTSSLFRARSHSAIPQHTSSIPAATAGNNHFLRPPVVAYVKQSPSTKHAALLTQPPLVPHRPSTTTPFLPAQNLSKSKSTVRQIKLLNCSQNNNANNKSDMNLTPIKEESSKPHPLQSFVRGETPLQAATAITTNSILSSSSLINTSSPYRMTTSSDQLSEESTVRSHRKAVPRLQVSPLLESPQPPKYDQVDQPTINAQECEEAKSTVQVGGSNGGFAKQCIQQQSYFKREEELPLITKALTEDTRFVLPIKQQQQSNALRMAVRDLSVDNSCFHDFSKSSHTDNNNNYFLHTHSDSPSLCPSSSKTSLYPSTKTSILFKQMMTPTSKMDTTMMSTFSPLVVYPTSVIEQPKSIIEQVAAFSRIVSSESAKSSKPPKYQQQQQRPKSDWPFHTPQEQASAAEHSEVIYQEITRRIDFSDAAAAAAASTANIHQVKLLPAKTVSSVFELTESPIHLATSSDAVAKLLQSNKSKTLDLSSLPSFSRTNLYSHSKRVSSPHAVSASPCLESHIPVTKQVIIPSHQQISPSKLPPSELHTPPPESVDFVQQHILPGSEAEQRKASIGDMDSVRIASARTDTAGSSQHESLLSVSSRNLHTKSQSHQNSSNRNLTYSFALPQQTSQSSSVGTSPPKLPSSSLAPLRSSAVAAAAAISIRRFTLKIDSVKKIVTCETKSEKPLQQPQQTLLDSADFTVSASNEHAIEEAELDRLSTDRFDASNNPNNYQLLQPPLQPAPLHCSLLASDSKSAGCLSERTSTSARKSRIKIYHDKIEHIKVTELSHPSQLILYKLDQNLNALIPVFIDQTPKLPLQQQQQHPALQSLDFSTVHGISNSSSHRKDSDTLKQADVDALILRNSINALTINIADRQQQQNYKQTHQTTPKPISKVKQPTTTTTTTTGNGSIGYRHLFEKKLKTQQQATTVSDINKFIYTSTSPPPPPLPSSNTNPRRLPSRTAKENLMN